MQEKSFTKKHQGKKNLKQNLKPWLFRHRFQVFLGIILLFMTAAFIMDRFSELDLEGRPFREFEDELKGGEVDTVYVDTEELIIRYTLLNEETKLMTAQERDKVSIRDKEMYQTDYPLSDEKFSREVLDNGASLRFQSFKANNLSTLLYYMVEFLPLFIVYYFMMEILRKQLNFGTSGEIEPETIKDVSFKDVIGQDEVVKDLKLELSIMQNSEQYQKIGVKPTKGLLLCGPPGTGKTMLAKALANEAQIPFYYVNSSSLVDRFVGMGAKNVRSIFESARKHQPCILFLDEIDAVGGKRDAGFSTSEHAQTLNALLQELDGFKTSQQVFIIAATNREDRMDPALLRSGRFDRKIVIVPPRDLNTRKNLFKHYLKGSVSGDADIDNVARQTAGFTGADIAQICNEAKIVAIQKGKLLVDMPCLEEAIDKFLLRGNRSRLSYRKDLETVAFHESGHALSMLLNGLKVARISIIPNTAGVGGMVVQSDNESDFVTKGELQKRIKSLYAGRAAEEIIFGPDSVTSGAANDIEKARKAILSYILEYGFDEESGLAAEKDEDGIKERIRTLSEQFYIKCKAEIEANIDILRKIAEKVLEKESLSGEEVTALYESFVATYSVTNEELLSSDIRHKVKE